ncbi:hypothetical protein XELAEV_18034098mg [Xenopus laevis]|uniref:Uncharacterized protein n=1 Tax=Xenopus laevis TaxID=8355 RepID=A0A974HEN2_XENLA|nr:hypothetical protein XELAEV_18034098mg [Xenopus laevis]
MIYINHDLAEQVPYCQKLLEKVFGVDVIKEALGVTSRFPSAAATPEPEVKNIDSPYGLKKLEDMLRTGERGKGNRRKSSEENKDANIVREGNNVWLNAEPLGKEKAAFRRRFSAGKKSSSEEHFVINKLLHPKNPNRKHRKNQTPATTITSNTPSSIIPPIEESRVEEITSPTLPITEEVNIVFANESFTEAEKSILEFTPVSNMSAEVNSSLLVNTSTSEPFLNQQQQNAQDVAEPCQPLQEHSLCFNDQLLSVIVQKINDIVDGALSDIIREVYALGEEKCPT